jgi:shikimate kinase/3-dehydroquinate synthase
MTGAIDLSTDDSTDRLPPPEPGLQSRSADLVQKLEGRSIVLVGMMGAGKTSIGRRLAATLGLPFVDADVEIETAAGMTISEIFARHGEAYFRDGERRVIARILADGQRVLATGGGAYINPVTRERIAEKGVSIWLKADAEVLLRRVRKRPNRPLLHTRDPEQTLRELIDARYPVYALADFCLISREGPHDFMVQSIMETLERGLETLPRLQHAPKEQAMPAEPQDSDASATSRTMVPVELGSRRYEILIGDNLLAEAGAQIARIAPKAACAIVTDETVARHHLPALEASLEAAGIRHARIVIAPGEASKCWTTFARVCDEIIAARMERGDLVVALGGGVVGDLAGFAAAAIRRGMRFVQIPTTLLAQVDSSVGGKTAINSEHGKNLIGAFHQPSLVLADTSTLATLDPREFRAGYAEVAKYGLIDDAPFFAWLEQNWEEIFARGPALTQAIAISCRSKAAVVARDETEQGDRALLNLGHTFGHAFESLTHFNTARLNHGEGVAIGMGCAYRFSAKLGHCAPEDAQRVERHLRAVGLPSRISDIAGWNAGPQPILDAMFQDKKVERGALTFILARGIGQTFIAKGVPAEAVSDFLRDELGS